MTEVYAAGSKVRVKASPGLLEKGFTDSWAGIEGVVFNDYVSSTGSQAVRITHDPHGLREKGSVYHLVNLELVEGAVAKTDPAVEHPDYYGGDDNPYEVIKVIEAWGLGFVLGNVVKYVARAGKKPGNSEVQDLKKARDYINKRIEKLEEN